jgi:hypothetical protein
VDVAGRHRDDVFPSLDIALSGRITARRENGAIPAPTDRMTPSGGQRRCVREHFASLCAARVYVVLPYFGAESEKLGSSKRVSGSAEAPLRDLTPQAADANRPRWQQGGRAG